jgi:membrane protease YdiL (CAAX protease family)
MPPPGPSAPQASWPPPPAAAAAQWPPLPASPPPGAWPPGYAATPWPPAAPGYRPAPWAYGPIPRPAFTPPGQLHPTVPPRPVLSLAGRASPRLYAAGLILGLPFFGLLIGLAIASRLGLHLGPAGAVSLAIVSVVSAVGLIAAALAQARQRRADGWQDYAGPSPFLATAAVLSLGQALSVPLLVALRLWTSIPTDGAVADLLSMLLALATYVGLLHFLVVGEGAMTWRDMGRPERLAPDSSDPPVNPLPPPWGPTPGRIASRLPGDIGLAVALVIPAVIGTLLLLSALMQLLGLNERDITSPVPSSVTPDDRWLIFLVVAVLAPIGEELFFRGFAANAWARSLSRTGAIMRAGLFFAFIHVTNVGPASADIVFRAAILAFAARIPVALALSWLYLSRRSIYASVALHAGYNAGLLLLAWAVGGAIVPAG